MASVFPLILSFWIATSLVGAAKAQELEARGQPYNHGNLTQYEQYMFELINRARADPNAEASRFGISLNQGLPANSISSTPKPPLASHPRLIQAARDHSSWMLSTGNFSHQGSGGSDPHARMSTAGYSFTGFWGYAENISWGGSAGTPNYTELTRARHESLFRSPSHRLNLMDPEYEELGIGNVAGSYSNMQGLMVTQDFATSDSTPSPFLVGVIFADANGNNFYDPGEGVPNVTIAPTEGNWHAISSAVGGYTLPYPATAGTLTIKVGGGTIENVLSFELPKTGFNLKLDVNTAHLRQIAFVVGSITVSPSGSFQASVIGNSGTIFDLQHSLDLQTWSTVSTYQMGNSPLIVTDQSANADRPHFYRLRWNR